MMASITNEALRRLRTAKDTLRAIDSAEKDGGGDDTTKASKGLLFVQLYAVYEFVVDALVKRLCAEVNARSLQAHKTHSGVLTLALDSDFVALRDLAIHHSWERRHALLQAIRDDGQVVIRDGLFPGDGSQFRIPQLELIWRLFNVKTPLVVESRWRGRVDEMVEKRNAIAHGREAPAAVGGGFAVADLSKRIEDTEAMLTHLIQSVGAYAADLQTCDA